MTLAGLPAGYVPGKQLKAGPISRVYTATRDTGAEVILKCYGCGDESLTRAQRECDALRSVTHAGVPGVLELLVENDGPTLVMERVRGLRLDRMAEETPLSIEALIEVALQLTEILAAVHESHLVHRDVSPEHVFIDPETLHTSLIDFGRALPLGSVLRGGSDGLSTGMPLYSAPEQSGLINHGCDFRTDLYSLGATLYHGLCGRPPFLLGDVRELLHAHIARRPESPSALRPDVPEPLARLVLKLLSKEPDDRYQRARGVYADLVQLRDQLRQDGDMDPGFELGLSDAPERPHFQGRIYGRDREIGMLCDAYASAASGMPLSLWIRGDAGAGKSALVEALRQRVGETGGYLARSKFGAYSERPYATCAAAIEALVSHMLMESDAHLERWRGELRKGLGNVAGALVQLVPDLETVLGEVAPVPRLGPRETQARLALSLRRFVEVVATPEHPLVLFFDDLHWSDPGGRFLISELLSGQSSAAFLLLCAYRTQNGEDPREVSQLRERLVQRGVRPGVLDVGPLDLEATVEMLSDALGRVPEETRPLAQQLGQRMGHRPLLVRQFVEHIREQGLLRYVYGQGWTWDLEEVASASIPDGAVALLTARLHRLDPDARSVIEFASCMGGEFDADHLQELGCQVDEGVRAVLYRLAEAGLVAVCPGGFRFTHDRLREAARALLSDEQRSRLHFETGRLLLADVSGLGRGRVFETADHLDRGLDHLTPDLRLPVIEVNLQAGKAALAAGAASDADRFLEVACRLSEEGDWAVCPGVCLEVRLEAAEAAFQTGDFDRSLAALEGLDERASSELDLARVVAKRLQVFSLTKDPDACLTYAQRALRRLGIRWPLHPSRLRTELAMRWTRWLLRGRSGERLLRPATRLDPRIQAILLVAAASAPARAKVDARLSGLAASVLMRQILRHGYTAGPSYLLASLGLQMQGVLEDHKLAARLGAEALDLLKRVPDPVYGPRTHFVVHALLRPWVMSRRSALAPLESVVKAFQESGDAEWANYARFVALAYRSLAGDPVDEVDRALIQQARDVRRSGHRYPEPALTRYPYRLLGIADPSTIRFENEIAASEREIRDHAQSAEPYVRTLWMLVLCVYGRYDLAFEQSQALGARLFRVTPYIHVADHTLYRALAAAELGLRTPGSGRRRARRELKWALRRLDRWSRGGPDFAHMVKMLEAESARLGGQLGRANQLYEQATKSAEADGFPQNAALCAERWAQVLADMRRTTESIAVLRDAISRYASWGARGKVAALENGLSRMGID